MSDPAIEAAKKTWTGFAGGMFAATDPEYLGLLDAAREALKPVRELVEQMAREKYRPDTAYGVGLVLHSLRPLIYSTEELGIAGDDLQSRLLKQAESICALIRTHRALDNEFDGFLCTADGCDWRDSDVRNHGGHVADLVTDLVASRIQTAPMPPSPFASNS